MPSTTRSEPISGVSRHTAQDRPDDPRRPRVFYLSYDGLAEPLGRSQILPYMTRLAADYDITIVSFEKSHQAVSPLIGGLTEAGIGWIPLRYHRRPAVISTLADVLTGRRAVRGAARTRGNPAVVHVRSDVPALIADLTRQRGARLLFDIRGFWADERVEGGLWPADGWLYRLAKRCERRFYARADAVVTLTEASVPQIRSWAAPREVPVTVIPTCVDLERFGERPPRPGGPHAVWTGSIGTWYRFDLTARIAAALDMPLTVVTREVELARKSLGGYPASVSEAAPDEVPGRLFSGDVGLCLIASSFSKTASAPTRFAEYLAAGMPILVTRGVGDLEAIVSEHRIGAVLAGEDDAAIARAAHSIRALAADQAVRERCRAVARELFDVEVGAARYRELYRRLLDG